MVVARMLPHINTLSSLLFNVSETKLKQSSRLSVRRQIIADGMARSHSEIQRYSRAESAVILLAFSRILNPARRGGAINGADQKFRNNLEYKS